MICFFNTRIIISYLKITILIFGLFWPTKTFALPKDMQAAERTHIDSPWSVPIRSGFEQRCRCLPSPPTTPGRTRPRKTSRPLSAQSAPSSGTSWSCSARRAWSPHDRKNTRLRSKSEYNHYFLQALLVTSTKVWYTGITPYFDWIPHLESASSGDFFQNFHAFNFSEKIRTSSTAEVSIGDSPYERHALRQLAGSGAALTCFNLSWV